MENNEPNTNNQSSEEAKTMRPKYQLQAI